jgi:hypothetical protein
LKVKIELKFFDDLRCCIAEQRGFLGVCYVFKYVHTMRGHLPDVSVVKKGKDFLLQAVEAPSVARGRGSHIT